MYKSLLLFTFLALGLVCSAQSNIHLFENLYTFSGERSSQQKVDVELLYDPVNDRIADSCTNGASISKLELLDIPDLKARLEKLQTAKLIVKRNQEFFLNIPVIRGSHREEISRLVDERARQLTPSVAHILTQIESAVPGSKEMAFHLLWSRIMDKMWYRTWQLEKRPGKGPPFVRWIIYPAHSFSFGTVCYDGAIGGGSNCKSWSRGSICGTYRPAEYQAEILAGAWGEKLPSSKIHVLESVGLFDDKGVFTGFSYHRDDPVDKLLDRLITEYAVLVANAYPYKHLSRSLDLPEDELWVVIQHETAYAILRNLSEAGQLSIPDPLKGIGSTGDCRSAISIRLVNPPKSN